jgi:integrase
VGHKIRTAEKHIPRTVDRPKPKRPDIKPYSETDIRAMLGSLERSKAYRRRKITFRICQPERSRVIIYLLLDTGMRASELCIARIKDLDINNRKIHILGKGDKERTLNISPRTSTVLWRFLNCTGMILLLKHP